MRWRDLEPSKLIKGKWYIIPDGRARDPKYQRFSRWQFDRTVRATRRSWKSAQYGGKIKPAREGDPEAVLVHCFKTPRREEGQHYMSDLFGVRLDARQGE